ARILAVVQLRHSGGAGQQAAVVAGDLEAEERLFHRLLQARQAEVAGQDLQNVLHRLAQGGRAVDRLFHLLALVVVFLQVVLGRLQAREAGGAGDREIPFHLLGQREVLGAKRKGEQLVHVVGRGGAAA